MNISFFLKRDQAQKTYTDLLIQNVKYVLNFKVLNAFSTQDDPETKGKVICRLDTIAMLADMLNKCLQGSV